MKEEGAIGFDTGQARKAQQMHGHEGHLAHERFATGLEDDAVAAAEASAPDEHRWYAAGGEGTAKDEHLGEAAEVVEEVAEVVDGGTAKDESVDDGGDGGESFRRRVFTAASLTSASTPTWPWEFGLDGQARQGPWYNQHTGEWWAWHATTWQWMQTSDMPRPPMDIGKVISDEELAHARATGTISKEHYDVAMKQLIDAWTTRANECFSLVRAQRAVSDLAHRQDWWP